MKKLIFIFVIVALSNIVIAQTWSGYSGYLDRNTNIKDMAIYKDKLVMVGGFDTVNNFTAGGVIVWDGNKLDTLIGQSKNITNCLDVRGNEILFWGGFTDFGGTNIWSIIRYKNDTLIGLGSSGHGELTFMSSAVRDVAIDGSKYYFVSGTTGGISTCPTCKRIIEYDTITGWADVGGGIDYSSLNDIIVYNNELIVGGLYYGGVGNTIFCLGKWTGSEWLPLSDDQLNYNVLDMTVDTMNNFLYVAGGFTQIGSLSTGGIARWDGYTWSRVGDSYFDGWITSQSLAMYRNELIMGGAEATPGGKLSQHIMRFDGEEWYNLNGGTNFNTGCFAEYHDTLWVAGGFDTVGVGTQNIPSYRLAKWHMPANTHCNWLQSVAYVNDNLTVTKGETVEFYNNNTYASSWQWSVDGTNTATTQKPMHTFTDTGQHNVQVIVTQNGCVDTATITVNVQAPLAVTLEEQLKLKVFPNPNKGQFTVTFKNNQPLNLVVTDIQGKQMFKQNNVSQELSINTIYWPKGNYLLTLSDKNKQVATKKIVVSE